MLEKWRWCRKWGEQATEDLLCWSCLLWQDLLTKRTLSLSEVSVYPAEKLLFLDSFIATDELVTKFWPMRCKRKLLKGWLPETSLKRADVVGLCPFTSPPFCSCPVATSEHEDESRVLRVTKQKMEGSWNGWDIAVADRFTFECVKFKLSSHELI